MNRDGKKLIAWGKGTLLGNWLKAHPEDHGISYIVDSFQEKKDEFLGLPVYPSQHYINEDLGKATPVLFPVKNSSRREVRKILNSLGLSYPTGYLDSTDLFKSDFTRKAADFLGFKTSENLLNLAKAHDNNSHVPVETTVCGSWLLLECLKDTMTLNGHIAEVGAYRGGNSILMLEAMAMFENSRHYFVLDSFEGFPEFHEADPIVARLKYNEEYNLPEIYDRLSFFKNVKIIRGFVPDTFSKLPEKGKYSLVFFDCDLYEPAVATLDYFWDRILPGGYILIHDYIHSIYGGVTRAVDEFCKQKKLKPHVFFESTMACLKK